MNTVDPQRQSPEDSGLLPAHLREAPRHGYRGHRAAAVGLPASLTIAISREAGSRGTSIAYRAGLKLGWQVYNQETLEYLAQEGAFRQDLLHQLPPDASAWVEERLRQLEEAGIDLHEHSMKELAHLILTLGVHGEVLLVGRGAGHMLPSASTLHVRTVAPLHERTAYMSQWLRLTAAEAAEQVRLRDSRREAFIATHFHRQANDPHQYDLLLNSSLLGEELSAELIVHAARQKLAALKGEGLSPRAGNRG